MQLETPFLICFSSAHYMPIYLSAGIIAYGSALPRRTANISWKGQASSWDGKGAGSALRDRQSRTWAQRQALPGQADAKAECQLRAAPGSGADVRGQRGRCP